MLFWLLRVILAWFALCGAAWLLSRYLAAREVEEERERLRGLLARLHARECELRHMLEVSAESLEHRAYVSAVNELMWLAQTRRRYGERGGSDGWD